MSTPDLDATTAALLRATGRLIRRVRAEHPHELSIPHSQAMARLEELGPTNIADLARLEAVKPQSMGATLAALEEDGMVERRPHPSDGRQFLFTLTDKGLAARRDNSAAKRRWLQQAIAQLDPAEQRILAEATDLIWRIANS